MMGIEIDCHEKGFEHPILTERLFSLVFFQVRKSFFNDLNINNNVSIVDLLYQQFYTGSDTYPTSEEQDFMRNLFTSEAFVKHEFRYHR